MGNLANQLMQFKPDFVPRWLYLFLFSFLVLIFAAAAILGLWAASTQIEFL